MAKSFKPEITNKEQILGDVRNANLEKLEAKFQDIDQRTDTWIPIKEEDGTSITFVQNLQNHGGIFIYLENRDEFADCIRQLAPENGWEPLWCTSPIMQRFLAKHGIDYSETPIEGQKINSITDCECLVAQTGSIVLSETQAGSRQAYSTPDILLVVAMTGQIVGGLKDAFNLIKDKYQDYMPAQLTIVSGPSRTTDIEQSPVMGVSGARQVAVFLIEEE